MLKLKVKGFTLIEALITILILFIIIIGITSLITGSVSSTRDRIVMECLVNAANSAIEACRGGINLRNFECGGLNIQVTLDTDCSIITAPANTWDANCAEVTVITRYGNRQHRLTDLICRFWDGS